jgi:hypothetical protein
MSGHRHDGVDNEERDLLPDFVLQRCGERCSAITHQVDKSFQKHWRCNGGLNFVMMRTLLNFVMFLRATEHLSAIGCHNRCEMTLQLINLYWKSRVRNLEHSNETARYPWCLRCLTFKLHEHLLSLKMPKWKGQRDSKIDTSVRPKWKGLLLTKKSRTCSHRIVPRTGWARLEPAPASCFTGITELGRE